MSLGDEEDELSQSGALRLIGGRAALACIRVVSSLSRPTSPAREVFSAYGRGGGVARERTERGKPTRPEP